MKLRIMSDVHLEFGDYTIVPLPEDKEMVLVLAGDIGLVHKRNLQERYIPFLQRASAQFKAVILIMGNHEHYGGSFNKTPVVLSEAIAEANIPNVHFLNDQSVVIDDVKFIGSTLWTDCDKRSPYAGYLFQGMSDSRVVRIGPNLSLPYERKFSAQDTWVQHDKARKFISAELKSAEGMKTVVVTHHGVSLQSIHPLYAGSQHNMFYASEMTEFWYEHNPTLLIHGHTHKQFDYLIDDTLEHCQSRVIVNPRGYDGHEDTSGFNETLVVEV